MKNPIEIRFHGRGGQGAKTAAQLLVETALYEGKQVQAYPEYGPERTGAPVCVYARISDKPIKTYSPIIVPDIVVVIDETIAKTIDVTEGLSNDGILLVNSPKTPEEIMPHMHGYKGTIITVDATAISIRLLGRNVPNIAMLGALIGVTDIIKLAGLNRRIKEHMERKIGEQATKANIDMAKEAYILAKKSRK